MENGNLIKIENLTKYFKNHKVLDCINLTVKRGDIFGFLGPNGAGKSTTIYLLLGLLKPDSGNAFVDGKLVAENAGLRKKIGVLFEDHGMYDDLSVYNNLKYYGQLFQVKDLNNRIDELLNQFKLIKRKKDKLKVFSTGMKKKIAIIRALLHEPEILFLDEPTSGLDPAAQVDLRNYILTIVKNRKMTLFINSHNLSEVQKICNRIAIIDHGKILICDSLKNINQEGKRRADICVESMDDLNSVESILKDDFGITNYIVNNLKVTCGLENNIKLGIKTFTDKGVNISEFKIHKTSLEDIYFSIINNQPGE